MLVTQLGRGGPGPVLSLACHLLEVGNEADVQCPDLGREREAWLTEGPLDGNPPSSDQKLLVNFQPSCLGLGIT